MLRVLLVLEDFGESMFLQILLSKLGFNVATLKNPKLLSDSLITHNPDLVVLTAKGKRVSGVELAASLKRTNNKPRLVWMATQAMKQAISPAESSHTDLLLDSPTNPTSFLTEIAALCELNSETLLAKYRSMRHQIAAASPELEASPLSEETGEPDFFDRSATPNQWNADKHKKFLKLDHEPRQKTFNKQFVMGIVKALRKEKPAPGLEGERQSFVKALFKKLG